MADSPSRVKYWIVAILLLLLLILLVLFIDKQLRKQSKSEPAITAYSGYENAVDYVYHHYETPHTPFGLPQDADTTDEFILVREDYVLSYCGHRNAPNWVAWQLNSSWVGETERFKGQFLADTSLPDSFYVVRHRDYTHTGYDRGHLLRSKERSNTDEANRNTFFLSNVVPQTPDLNRGVWLRFEDYYLRKAVTEGANMYLIAGGVYHTTTYLHDTGKVAIPDSCFKIVLFTPETNSKEARSRTLSSLAVMMPNIQGIRNEDWRNYTTTIAAIEASTGYNFSLLLPDSIEWEIEQRSTYLDK
ncbi:MAG: DNA/RNA non-specific endonuclease [Schleiferiaceae bacterium]|nr:DNA/RNA non-specific endonuclease [Schleiferiaceae bacterium]